MGTLVFGFDSMDEVANIVASALSEDSSRRQNSMVGAGVGMGRGRRDMSTRVRDAVLALATCHNVRQLPLPLS